MPGDPRRPAARWRRQGLLSTGSAPAAPPAPSSIWHGELAPITIGIVVLITLNAFEAIGSITAMPVVGRELDALGGYTWAFNAYTVASLFAMVGSGLWADARGPRGPLIGGIAGFLFGSVIAGAATGLPMLVVGRSLQGMGGGAVMVCAYMLIARAYPVELRPKAFSLLSASWIVPSIVGPFIAGWLADSMSWRYVFWIVPILIIPVVVLLLPRISAYQGGTPQEHWRSRLLAGAAATAGLFLLQDGALRLSPVGYLEAAMGLLVLVMAMRRVLPPGALTLRRGLPSSVMMRFFLAGGYFAAEVFIPLALVQIRGVSTTVAGLTIAISGIAWATGSYAQSRLSATGDRAHAVRLGAAILTVSIVSLPLSLIAGLPSWLAALSWAGAAAGMGLSVPSISVQVLRLSPERDQGVNSAAIQIVDAVGFSVAVAALGVGYASAVAAGGATAATYTALWLSAAAIAAVVIVIAGRMRPRIPR